MTLFIRICLLFVLSITVLHAENEETNECKIHHCLGVVDAGSSGTRFHIFSFENDSQQQPIKIREIWFNQTNQALASMDTDQNLINAYLDELFLKTKLTDFPIYFYATAGMRLLSVTNQDAHYQAVKQWFAKHPTLKLKQIKTITGDEEALFGWLSVNYHLGALSDAKKNLVGLMDFGGASAQIIFPVTNTQSLPSRNIKEIQIKGRKVRLFVHSFLGLGQNLVLQQMLDFSGCFTDEYPLPNQELAQSNLPQCRLRVAMLVNDVHQVKSLIQHALKKNKVSTWYVLGGVAKSVDTKPPYDFKDNVFTIKAFYQQTIASLCRSSWKNLNQQLSHTKDLYRACFNGAYVYALAVDGYGINTNQPLHFFPKDKNIDWTLGVLLHQE